MKKHVSLALFLVLIIVSHVACSSKTQPSAPQSASPQYTVLEVGGYDYISNAVHSAEFSILTEETVEFDSPQEIKVKYNDTEYSAIYDCTSKGYLFNSEVEHYVQKEDGNQIQFGINKGTGNIDRYVWLSKDYLNATNLVEKSKEDCLAAAKEYLASYVDDIDSYELIGEQYWEIPEYGAIYDLDYARIINGVKTSDYASINITIYGTVVSHHFVSLGEMKAAHLPNQEKMIAIQTDVDEKLTNIYASLKGEYSVSYELNKMVFSKLADGRYALEYYYEVELCQLGEGFRPMSEMTHLIVVLEDS